MMEAKTAQIKVAEVKHMTKERVGEGKIVDEIADILTKNKTEADKAARTMLGVNDKYDFKDDPSKVTDKEKYEQAMAQKTMAGYVVLAGIKGKSPEWKKALTEPTIDKIHDLIPSVYFGLENEILTYAKAGEGLEHVALKNRAYGEGSLLTASQEADKTAGKYLKDLKEGGYAKATMQGLDKKTAKKAEKSVAKEAKASADAKAMADKEEIERIARTISGEPSITSEDLKDFDKKYPGVRKEKKIVDDRSLIVEKENKELELYSVKGKGGGFEFLDFNQKTNMVKVKGPYKEILWVKFTDLGRDKGEMKHYDFGYVTVMEKRFGKDIPNGEYKVVRWDNTTVVVEKPFGDIVKHKEIPMAEFNKRNPDYWERKAKGFSVEATDSNLPEDSEKDVKGKIEDFKKVLLKGEGEGPETGKGKEVYANKYNFAKLLIEFDKEKALKYLDGLAENEKNSLFEVKGILSGMINDNFLWKGREEDRFFREHIGKLMKAKEWGGDVLLVMILREAIYENKNKKLVKLIESKDEKGLNDALPIELRVAAEEGGEEERAQKNIDKLDERLKSGNLSAEEKVKCYREIQKILEWSDPKLTEVREWLNDGFANGFNLKGKSMIDYFQDEFKLDLVKTESGETDMFLLISKNVDHSKERYFVIPDITKGWGPTIDTLYVGVTSEGGYSEPGGDLKELICFREVRANKGWYKEVRMGVVIAENDGDKKKYSAEEEEQIEGVMRLRGLPREEVIKKLFGPETGEKKMTVGEATEEWNRLATSGSKEEKNAFMKEKFVNVAFMDDKFKPTPNPTSCKLFDVGGGKYSLFPSINTSLISGEFDSYFSAVDKNGDLANGIIIGINVPAELVEDGDGIKLAKRGEVVVRVVGR